MGDKKVFRKTKSKANPEALDSKEAKLISLITHYVTKAESRNQEVAGQNEDSLDAYFGNPNGTEVAGKSQVVSQDVADTIEWIMPQLMRMFTTTKHLANFTPQGPEDEESTKEASEWVDYVWWRQNKGFINLHDWMKDALLQKQGTIKIWWDTSEKVSTESYTNLDQFQRDAIVNEETLDEIKVLEEDEITETRTVVNEQQQIEKIETKFLELKLSRTRKTGKTEIALVPFEEFLVEAGATSLEDALYTAHKSKITISRLREMFPDEDIDEKILDDTEGPGEPLADNRLKLARNSVDNSSSLPGEDRTGNWDPTLREVTIIESYLFHDWDEDGKAELRLVTTVGKRIFQNEPIDRHPFHTITPIRIPHKRIGLSVADIVKDIQRIKTALLRNRLDNEYLQNNTQKIVLENFVNYDDLLSSRPGGVIRVKRMDAVQPLVTPALGSSSLDMLNYMDSVKEGRTGVSKDLQGLGEDTLNSHVTQLAQMSRNTMAMGRIELIARIFADTGIESALKAIYTISQKNVKGTEMVLLNGSFTPFRPSAWRDEMDLTVDVGLGHGNKDHNLIHLNNLAQMAAGINQQQPGMVQPVHYFNMFSEVAFNAGFKNPEKFMLNPGTEDLPEEQKGPSKEEVKLQEIQINAQQKEKDRQIDIMKLQLAAEDLKLKGSQQDFDQQIEAMRLALDADELEFEKTHEKNISTL